MVGQCHVCASTRTAEIHDYKSLRRVTSDCQPFRSGGSLLVCSACSTVQKAIDAVWRSDADAIYHAYAIYLQSGGIEQATWREDTGEREPRSLRLATWAARVVGLPMTGRLLDVGCGNGALLRSFSLIRPGWDLAGQELNETFRDEVERIPSVQDFYVGDLSVISRVFDVVSLVHVLEHVPDPIGFLRAVRKKLAPEGLLVIQVPSYLMNPFDLMVADHATHFTIETLSWVVREAGFDPMVVSDIIPRELSLLARRIDESIATPPANTDAMTAAIESVTWLRAVRDAVRDLAQGPRLGVFGTSIAGTWLAVEVPEATFFVDEDAHRIGRAHLGKPILDPRDVPSGSNVVIALPPRAAERIAQRLTKGRTATYGVVTLDRVLERTRYAP